MGGAHINGYSILSLSRTVQIAVPHLSWLEDSPFVNDMCFPATQSTNRASTDSKTAEGIQMAQRKLISEGAQMLMLGAWKTIGKAKGEVLTRSTLALLTNCQDTYIVNGRMRIQELRTW